MQRDESEATLTTDGLRVGMATDRNYLWPFAVALHSYVRQAGRPIEVLLALPEDWVSVLGEENLASLESLGVHLGVPFVPTPVSIATTDLPPTLHISPMAFVKPALFDAVAGSGLLVWLDSDALAVREWTSMTACLEGHVLAAAREHAPDFEAAWPQATDTGWYVNTGMMVVDTDRWGREYADRWRPLLADYTTHGFRWLDQDIINALVGDATDVLPPEYNARLNTGSFVGDPRILHFAGWWKPWMRTSRQMRLLRGPVLRAFEQYASAENELLGALGSSSQSLRRDWEHIQRKTRGTLDWRASLHYVRGVLRRQQ